MRMSDSPTVAVNIFIEAPPSRVWQLITDLNLMGEWSPEYQGGEWLEGVSPSIGARFKGYNKRGERRWESISTVVEIEADQSFSWAVGDPTNPGSTWRFELIPEGAGTRVRQHVTLGPGSSGLTARITEMPDRETDIIESRRAEHRRNMSATLAGLKAYAEQGS